MPLASPVTVALPPRVQPFGAKHSISHRNGPLECVTHVRFLSLLSAPLSHIRENFEILVILINIFFLLNVLLAS